MNVHLYPIKQANVDRVAFHDLLEREKVSTGGGANQSFRG